MKKLYFVLSTFLLLLHPELNAQIAKCKGKYLGNIITKSVQSNYAANWNQLSMESASRWQTVERIRGQYDFAGSDIGYNWAKENGGLFTYNSLMWGATAAAWVPVISTELLQESIQLYFKAVADHYNTMGGLKLIQVLNEPVHTQLAANLKAALVASYKAEVANAADINNKYGWAIYCFQLARKHFPNSTLIINDYYMELNINNCRATYIEMINAIKGAPNLTDGKKNLIDGVGLEGHEMEDLSGADFKACLDEIWSKTGIPMHITEFDAKAYPNEAKQKYVYSTMIPIAWEHPHVAGISFLGYIQGQTWASGNGIKGPEGTDTGIMYATGEDRPAMSWLRSYMAGKADLLCCPAPGPSAACDSLDPSVTAVILASGNSQFTAGQNEVMGLDLYPNPFTNEGLHIKKSGEFHYCISDIYGATVENGIVKEQEVVAKNLSPGVYYIRIDDQQSQSAYKIIRQ